jgi:hypothetical protein
VTKTLDADNLAALREELEALQLQREAAALRQELRARELELAVVQEAWGDLVDRREYLHDDPNWSTGVYSQRAATAADRLHGSYPPHYECEADLHAIRGLARWLCATDEQALGILENLTNYVLGPGFEYTVSARAGVNEDLAAAAQGVLDEFLERSGWSGDLERELFQRGVTDGEWFLHVQDAGGGRSIACVVEPEWVTQPAQARQLEDYYGLGALDWHYGVGAALYDYEHVAGYYAARFGDAGLWEWLPASACVHAKHNVPRGCKRGLSDYYPVHQTLERAARLLGNGLQGAAVRAAIAYIVEHAPGTTGAQVTNLTRTLSDSTYSRATTTNGTKTVKVNQRDAGTRLDVEHGRQFHSGMQGSPEGPAHIAMIQAGLRRVLSRWAAPEFFTGDASNANYSSTLVAESPFVKASEQRQASFGRHTRRVMWRVLEVAAAHGRLPCEPAALRQVLDVQATAPNVATTNRVEQNTIDQSLRAEQALSLRSRQERAGLDPDEEAQRLAAESPSLPGDPAAAGGAAPIGADSKSSPPASGKLGKPMAPSSGQAVAPPSAPPPTAEMAGLGRGQWKNNRKAINDVLADVAAKAISEDRALIELSALGLSEQTARKLIDDALARGQVTVEDEEVEEDELTEQTVPVPRPRTYDERLAAARAFLWEGYP